MPSPRGTGTKHLFESRENPPQHYLIAHSDGGARGNPGPAGYGVIIQDESGRKVAALSEYLGHQTNNFAEYQGLIAALEYALKHGAKALKVISDSELLAQLDWFSIGHALRAQNQEADRLANEAMDQGMGRAIARASAGASPVHSSSHSNPAAQEFEGTVKNGVIELLNGTLPEGTRVQVRVKI